MKTENRNTLICVVIQVTVVAALSYYYNVSFEDYIVVLKDIIHGGVH